MRAAAVARSVADGDTAEGQRKAADGLLGWVGAGLVPQPLGEESEACWRTNRLFRRLRAWRAVVDELRRGATSAASGQSKAPNVGSCWLLGLNW